MGAESALPRAEELVERVQADPAATLDDARRLRSGADAEVDIVARWAEGLALRELGRIDDAVESLRSTAEAAAHAHLGSREGAIRVSLALALANRGDTGGALEELDTARPLVSVRDRPRLYQQEALIRQRQGDLVAARTLYQRALDEIRRGLDPVLECRILSNLGVLEGYAGHVAKGIDLLFRSDELARTIDQPLLAARAAHNIGFLEGRRGNIPLGLTWLSEAGERYGLIDGAGNDRAILEADRAGLYLEAGLGPEALTHLDAALQQLGRSSNSVDVAELLLLEAKVLQLADERPRATEGARAAAEVFEHHGRPAWAHIARAVEHDSGGSIDWRPLERVAVALERLGAVSDSRRIRLRALDHAVAALDLNAAATLRRAFPRHGRSMTYADRAEFWRLTAELRHHSGDVAGTKRALRAGLRATDGQQALLGSFELRARSASASAAITELGTRLAIDARRSAEIFDWVEVRRASSLRREIPPVPDDRSLRDDLAEIRLLQAAEEVASRSGGHSRQARLGELEHKVRRRLFEVSGGEEAAGDLGSVRARMMDHVGERTVLSFFVLDSALHTLVAHADGVEHHPLGPAGAIRPDIDHVTFAIRRLNRMGASSGARGVAARASLKASLESLDDTLLGPLWSSIATSPEIVIVPCAEINDVPWLVLPRIADRTVSVVPSVDAWIRAAQRTPDAPGSSLVVAGPGLAGAHREVDQLAVELPDPERLVGDDASIEAVRTALGRASTAHIAAHGRFRHDSPMFSYFLLADGAFSLYELRGLGALPSLCVLPVCQGAASAVLAGGEVLGFSAALLSLGVRTVVAPLHVVSDTATEPLMVEFHRGLLSGLNPCNALRRASQVLDTDTGASLAAATSFVVVGASD